MGWYRENNNCIKFFEDDLAKATDWWCESPRSPIFRTAEELAMWLTKNSGVPYEMKISYDRWLDYVKFGFPHNYDEEKAKKLYGVKEACYFCGRLFDIKELSLKKSCKECLEKIIKGE